MLIKGFRVRDYMNSEPLTVSQDTSIMEAVSLLVSHDISVLLVVSDDNALVGMLTERDCIGTALQSEYFGDCAGQVRDFMTPSVHAVAPDASLMDVAQFFCESPFRRCPVVEAGCVVGLVTRRDILRLLIEPAFMTSTHPES
jgi:CBS domain-containing protein